MAGPASKRKARTLVLQTLYEVDTVGHDPEESLLRLVAAEGVARVTSEFAQRLLQGVQDNRRQIDETIHQTASLRPIEDLSPIDRNILRVAIYELLFDNKAPIAAVINEAVELAQKFGGEGSSRFVNGVLGTVSMSLTR